MQSILSLGSCCHEQLVVLSNRSELKSDATHHIREAHLLSQLSVDELRKFNFESTIQRSSFFCVVGELHTAEDAVVMGAVCRQGSRPEEAESETRYQSLPPLTLLNI
jgi:hypothetical protein